MENRDEKLWHIAKKRAGFKKHLATYIIINGFFWALWFFSKGHDVSFMDDEDLKEMNSNPIPWPIWSALGWGVGLAFSYYKAYHDDQQSDTMREYQKLKEKEKK
jgi:hypothetical protein